MRITRVVDGVWCCKVLLSGDSLAVVGDELAFMARFVILDKQAARESMQRQAELRPATLCPGHRFHTNATHQQWDRFIAQLRGDAWPIFGRL